MASEAEIDHYKAVLRGRGVPEKFVDDLAGRPKPRSGMVVLIGFVLVVAAIIAGPALLWNRLIPTVAPLLWPGARESLLFFAPYPLQITLLLGTLAVIGMFLFAAVFVTVAVINRDKPRRLPVNNDLAVSLRTLHRAETMDRLRPNPVFADYADLADGNAFLAALRPLPSRLDWPQMIVTQIVMLALTVFMLFTIDAELSTRIVTLESVRNQWLIPTKVYPLARAQYAEVTCHSGSSSGRFQYVLYFHHPHWNKENRRPFVVSQPVDRLHHLDADQTMERLAQLDARLSELHVPIHRMPATGSVHDDALDCVEDTARRWQVHDTRTLSRLTFGE